MACSQCRPKRKDDTQDAYWRICEHCGQFWARFHLNGWFPVYDEEMKKNVQDGYEHEPVTISRDQMIFTKDFYKHERRDE